RRQDHDVPAPCRAGAARARPFFPRNERPMDEKRALAGRRHGEERSRGIRPGPWRALPGDRAAGALGACAPAWNALVASAWKRCHGRGARAAFRRHLVCGRGRLFDRTRVGDERRGYSVAAHEVRAAHERERARKLVGLPARRTEWRPNADAMKPLAALPDTARRNIRCVLTDIDDTL